MSLWGRYYIRLHTSNIRRLHASNIRLHTSNIWLHTSNIRVHNSTYASNTNTLVTYEYVGATYDGMRVIKMKCTIFYFIFTRARASSCAQIHETGFHSVMFCSSSWVCVVAVTLVPESREAVRRKNLWFIWTWTSLSYRRQGQDLTLGLGLVDIFKLKHVNQYMVGPFDWQHRGDDRDICRCASCGK